MEKRVQHFDQSLYLEARLFFGPSMKQKFFVCVHTITQPLGCMHALRSTLVQLFSHDSEYTNTHTHTHTRKHAHTCAHLCTHAHTHTHAHMQTHTHTHTHTYMLAVMPVDKLRTQISGIGRHGHQRQLSRNPLFSQQQ